MPIESGIPFYMQWYAESATGSLGMPQTRKQPYPGLKYEYTAVVFALFTSILLMADQMADPVVRSGLCRILALVRFQCRVLSRAKRGKPLTRLSVTNLANARSMHGHMTITPNVLPTRAVFAHRKRATPPDWPAS